MFSTSLQKYDGIFMLWYSQKNYTEHLLKSKWKSKLLAKASREKKTYIQLNTALVTERPLIAFRTDVTLQLNSLNLKRKGKQKSMRMKRTVFNQKNPQVSKPQSFQKPQAMHEAAIYIYIWMWPSWLKWTTSDINYAYMNMVRVRLHLIFFLKRKKQLILDVCSLYNFIL